MDRRKTLKVLITGATGFVGSWICKKLLEQQHRVVTLVRNTSAAHDLLDLGAEAKLGDVTDLASLESALGGVETVFHLAGVVGYSRTERSLMERVNVDGTANVLTAMQSRGVKKLVYMSSVVAVGASQNPTTILDESSPFSIHHLNLGYFETKYQAEQLVLEAFRNKQIEGVILNPSTIYGAGDAKKGSRKTQIKVARGSFPFFTSGGVSIVSIHDVVAATLQAWRSGRNGERYILSGDNITIKQLFGLIAEAAGVPAPRYHLPNFAVHTLGKVGDALEAIGKKGVINSENAWTSTMYHWFSSKKAQQELNFRPRSAKSAIQESVDWMRSNDLLNSGSK